MKQYREQQSHCWCFIVPLFGDISIEEAVGLFQQYFTKRLVPQNTVAMSFRGAHDAVDRKESIAVDLAARKVCTRTKEIDERRDASCFNECSSVRVCTLFHTKNRHARHGIKLGLDLDICPRITFEKANNARPWDLWRAPRSAAEDL